MLCGLVAGSEKSETIDQEDLLEGRSADQPAVVKLGRRKRSFQSRFAARDTRNAALNEQSGGNNSAPGSDPVEPDDRLVCTAVEMASASNERVQKRRSIPAVAAREDVRRISGPEQDAFTPETWGPGIIDLGPVSD